MTTKELEEKVYELLTKYRESLFFAKDYGLDNPRSVALVALTTVNTKDSLVRLLTKD